MNKAITIGRKALEIIRTEKTLKVRGISSRGIFLEANNEWIIFISGEAYRGPLTMNVSNLEMNAVQVKDEVLVRHSDQEIIFRKSCLSINYSSAQRYAPHIPGFSSDFNWSAAWQRVGETIGELGVRLYNRNPELGFSDQKIAAEIKRIPVLVQGGNLGAVLDLAGRMLGAGQGLTPQGDDFWIGFLYILRVATSGGLVDTDFYDLLRIIPAMARKRTTRISVNLILCAAEGMVDERIQAFIEALFQDSPSLEGVAREMLGWGKTSGRMVLLGILSGLALIQLRETN